MSEQKKSNPIREFLKSKGINDPLFHDFADKGWDVAQKVKQEAEQMTTEFQDAVESATAKPFLITFTHGPYSGNVHDGAPFPMTWSQLLVYGNSFEHACEKIKAMPSEYPNAQGFKNQTIL